MDAKEAKQNIPDTVEDVARVRPLRALRALFAVIVLVAAFELIVRQPGSFWAVFGMVIGFVLLVVLSHGKRSWREREDRSVVLLTLLLTALSMLFLLFPVGKVVQHVVAVLLALAISVLLFVFRKPVLPEMDGSRVMLPEVFVYLTAFLGFGVFFGGFLFYVSWSQLLSIIVLLLSVSVLTFFCAWQLFVYQSIRRGRATLYSLVITFAISQITWALVLWPTDSFSRAGVLFLSFYTVMGLAKHALKQRFTWRILSEYMVASAVVAALVLSTTQWVY